MMYRSGERQEAWIGSALLIVLIGAALGVAYNAVGLRSAPSFGLAWIGQDRAEDVFVLEAEGANGPATPTLLSGQPSDGAVGGSVTDDPLSAMMGQETSAEVADLPEIPVLDRPIQMQLSIVKRFFDANAALFIDAREADEYAEGHIPGALHVPFDAAVTDPALLETLPVAGRPIIVYCGGGACEVSINLAWELIGVGHSRVTYFQGGFPDWVREGFPVARTEEQG